MKEKLEADLKKYLTEIDTVNKSLAQLDEERARLIAHGRRIEGVVAYIRGSLATAEQPEIKRDAAEESAAK